MGTTANQMKVVHVASGISKEASGPSYSVVRLCETLGVYSATNISLVSLDWRDDGAKDMATLFPLGFGPRRLGRSPEMLRWLIARCTSGQVDVIHSHGMWQMNTVYPGWAARKSRAKLIVSPRGMLSEWAMANGSWIKKLFWPFLQRPALGYASCFHATSHSEFDDVRRLGFRQPVAIIPNGIDLPELSSAKVYGESRTLLFLGRLHPKKGLETLLSAWGAVQDDYRDWRLLIAGSDMGYYGTTGYSNRLLSLAHELALERVEFCGELRGAAKRQAYRDADLFVLPTHSENFGLTVAEALAAGTPCIVSKGAPWSGLETHNAGWWIDVGFEPLVACLRHAFGRSSEEAFAMGRRGREWMELDFSWPRVACQMAETYRWLLDRQTPVPAWVRTD